MRISDWSSDVCSSDLGEDILDPKYPMNRLRSKVGMVFQKPVPFPMTIFENVAYAIRHHEKLSKAEMNVRVEHALRQAALRSEEHTSELQSLMRISYAVFCLKKKNIIHNT